MKTSMTGDEPADVKQYQKSSPDFPHESTTDQWFSESQFESYRALGNHVVSSIVGDTRQATLQEFVQRADSQGPANVLTSLIKTILSSNPAERSRLGLLVITPVAVEKVPSGAETAKIG